jgi:hypothetical protein
MLSLATYILFLSFAAALVFAVVVAARYGGPSERWGMAVIFVGWTTEGAVQALTQRLPPFLAYIGMEFCVGFAFLLVAFRYGEVWAAWVMVLEGGILFVADGAVDQQSPFHNLYLTLSNVFSYAILSIVLFSVLTGKWRLERRAAKQEAAFARIHQETLSRFGADPPVEL